VLVFWSIGVVVCLHWLRERAIGIRRRMKIFFIFWMNWFTGKYIKIRNAGKLNAGIM